MSGAAPPSGVRSSGPGTWVAADPLRAVLAAIAVLTVFSGAMQIPFGGAVLNGVFASVALTVAVFDLAMAALCLIYLRRIYLRRTYWQNAGQEAER